MKKLISIFILFTIINCKNVATDCLKIKSISQSEDKNYKFKITLDTFIADTVLYTNENFEVGGSFAKCKGDNKQ